LGWLCFSGQVDGCWLLLLVLLLVVVGGCCWWWWLLVVVVVGGCSCWCGCCLPISATLLIALRLRLQKHEQFKDSDELVGIVYDGAYSALEVEPGSVLTVEDEEVILQDANDPKDD